MSDALWKRRRLVKLWGVRGTLHLLPAAELGIWLSALGTITNRGMTGHPDIDALTDAIGDALDGRVLTREELALEVEERTGDADARRVRPLQLGLVPQARLVPGSSLLRAERRRPRAVHLAGVVRPPSDRPARAGGRAARGGAALSRGLRARDRRGPRLWSGFGRARGKKMLAALGDEAVEIDVDGDRAWALARRRREIASAEPPDTARLLPAFDPWVVGTARYLPAQLDPALKARVFRPQGWISPVILVNGRMLGVWKHERKGRRLDVTIEPFGRLPRWARAQLEDEADRLAAFLELER